MVLQGLITKVQNVSISILSEVLKGSKDKDILNKRLDDCPLYGCMKRFTGSKVESILQTMIVKGVLAENGRYLIPGEKADLLLSPTTTFAFIYHEIK
jgi:superfamily II DNA helicase RecQ